MDKDYEILIDMANKVDDKISKYYDRYIEEITNGSTGDGYGVNYLIMPIGLNYEPSVITIALTRPKKILFLYTKESKSVLDKIDEHIHLKPEEYFKYEVDDIDPLNIYRIIDDCYQKWGKPKEIYIDITGGTKAMSVATALAGVFREAKLLYLSTENYIKSINRPEIGKEKLIKLDNPIKVFGDLDEEIALDHMEAYDYLSATGIFKQLMNRVPDGNIKMYYKILYLLSSGYEYWDNLEFKDAYNCFNEMINYIQSIRKYNENCVMADKLEELLLQHEILNVLAFEFENKMNHEIVQDIDNVLALLMTIYRSAKRRKYQEKYDMAVLLLYRMIEVIGQRRLAENQINYEDPDFYKVLGEQKYISLKVRYNKLRNLVFNDTRSYKLPRRHVTLLDGYFILAAIDDPLFEKRDKIEFLKVLYDCCKIRNQNIFAHGFKVINEEQYNEFESFAENVLKVFSKIEKIELNKFQKKVKFINPSSTMYIK